MKKQNIIIVGVLAFILAMCVGYALFSESLTIGGKATASGNFDIKFTKVGTITQVGSSGASATIRDGDATKLDISVPKLEYPTSYVLIPVTITNNGSINAELTSISATGLTENAPLKITYSGVSQNEVINANGGNKEVTIRVEWDADNNTTIEGANFTIQFVYTQTQ